jgi:transposase-like protein
VLKPRWAPLPCRLAPARPPRGFRGRRSHAPLPSRFVSVDLIEQVSNPLSTLSSLFKALDSKALRPVRLATSSNCRTEAPNHQVQTWLTSEQIAGLVEAYRSGSTVKDLAATHGIHRTTVLEHLKRQQVPRRRSKLNPVDINKAARMYAEGRSGEAIAIELRVGASTVRRELKKAGVEVRSPGRRKIGD